MEWRRFFRNPGSPRRRFRPSVDGLETREVAATAVSKLIATPALLTPPNGRFVQVTLTGYAVESNAKVIPTAQFQVSDEYRRYEPGGKVVLNRLTPTVYSFKFSIILQASRSSQDTAGRQYFVVVGSQDYQNAAGLTVPILVPYKTPKPGHALMSSSAHRAVRTH